MVNIELAPAKINLALHVLGRRADGFHLLDSIVVFADIADRISVSPAERTSLAISGPFAQDLADVEANIVLKAAGQMRVLAQAHAVSLPHFAIALEKNLPVASGIGGGSADAAATLRAVIRSIQNPPPALLQALSKIALSLGADVPVCFDSHPCRMQGIGEIISPATPRVPVNVMLINPRLPLVTKDVFGAMHTADYMGKQQLDPDAPLTWRNDMTSAAIKLLPQIAEILAAIRSEPVFSLVSMSGSGATCFGLAADEVEAKRAAHRIQVAHPEWWVSSGKILNL